MSPFFRVLAINAASGAAVALVFVAGLLMLDIAKLRSLLLADSDGLLALALLTGGFVVTFASVVMGTAIMIHAREDDGDGRPRAMPTLKAAVVMARSGVRARP